MNLDLRTLILLHALSSLMQAATLAAHRGPDRRGRGAAAFALGNLAGALGLLIAAFRDDPAWGIPAVIANNAILLGGTLYLRIAFRTMLGLPFRRLPHAALWLAASGVVAFLTLGIDSPNGRRLLILPLMAAFHLLNARDCLAPPRPAATRAPRAFLAAASVAHASGYLATAAVVIFEPPAPDLFSPALSHLLPYILSFVTTNFLSYGFIILVNAELVGENREERDKFATLFETGPDCVMVSDRDDGRLREVNEAFSQLTGHARAEALGKSCGELGLCVDGGAEGGGDRPTVETRLRRKDGTILTALLSSREILLGGAPRRISVVHDISDRKRGEERIHALLREKDLILKEVHHRIKNNLAVITGLLEVQASALGEGPAASALSDAKRRILSMSILYDRLYRLDGTGMASLADYLSAVVDRALDGFPRAGDLEVSREIEAVELDERSLSSLGIIVNELLTNSLKYAFSGRAGGRLRVFARREGGLLAFGVEDDGPGIPAAVREGGGEGFGLELVRVLAGQLGASLSFGAGGGSRVRLELPLEEAPAS